MPEKAKKIMVRIGFGDQVVSLEDAYNNEKEICSCDSYVVGYEDENGRECTSSGTYIGREVSNGNTGPQS